MGHHTDLKIEDIFSNWKEHKFVVVDSGASGLNIDFGVYPYTVVLADIGYWNEQYDELNAWCVANGCESKGMTVSVPSEQLATLFCLRWA